MKASPIGKDIPPLRFLVIFQLAYLTHLNVVVSIFGNRASFLPPTYSRLLMKGLLRGFGRLAADCRAAVFVEYLLLLSIVGIGAIAGLAAVRGALINELLELADAIAGLV